MVGDGVGVESGDGDADEVHQVVSGECQRQGECSREDRNAEDVDLELLDEEEHERADDPADEDGQQQMGVDPLDEGVAVEDGFQPLEDGEVDDCRERGAAPERAVAMEEGRVSEREDESGDIHDDRSAGKGDDH